MVGIADEELVEPIRRGDAQAFRVVVDGHRAWLTAGCRRHRGEGHAAEDVAHESLVALPRAVAVADKPLRARPWSSVVARSRCIDETRKQWAVPTALEGLVPRRRRRR